MVVIKCLNAGGYILYASIFAWLKGVDAELKCSTMYCIIKSM